MTAKHQQPRFPGYLKTPPPHVYSKESEVVNTWKKVLALVPVLGASFFRYGWMSVEVTGIAVLSGWAAEVAGKKLRGAKYRRADGSSLFYSLILAMLLPADIPLWVAAAGSFFGIFFARELFGGAGQNFFHPALAGYAFLTASFPVMMSKNLLPFSLEPGMAPSVILKTGYPLAIPSLSECWLGNYPSTLGTGPALAVLASGILLMVFLRVRWEIPVLFAGGVFLFESLGGGHPWVMVLTGPALLTAFFIVTDDTTTPHSVNALRVYAVMSAFLAWVIGRFSVYPDGCLLGVLIMNAATPWLNRLFRPSFFSQSSRGGG